MSKIMEHEILNPSVTRHLVKRCPQTVDADRASSPKMAYFNSPLAWKAVLGKRPG